MHNGEQRKIRAPRPAPLKLSRSSTDAPPSMRCRASDRSRYVSTSSTLSVGPVDGTPPEPSLLSPLDAAFPPTPLTPGSAGHWRRIMNVLAFTSRASPTPGSTTPNSAVFGPVTPPVPASSSLITLRDAMGASASSYFVRGALPSADPENRVVEAFVEVMRIETDRIMGERTESLALSSDGLEAAVESYAQN
ncbi:hypothetical protein PUNSTDRAFT_40948 [Punctularia strigosozonata HHB-11173 SS5]|uniref:uncharacterized protein n=1 Tax=Punctularia strigosozonata (strain HHB-11173) TaxID=741275 RepID=UPI0004417430|nr:uncharacterized protein PUNSTDRAFT_40948 [Punctularia strigosozonata HHB-11173 SS5]EIN13319.1 hypothetical protein PUNSTDRAFT_40948 [Punctularia strigosozonata HHB-11173 SS5]